MWVLVTYGSLMIAIGSTIQATRWAVVSVRQGGKAVFLDCFGWGWVAGGSWLVFAGSLLGE